MKNFLLIIYKNIFPNNMDRPSLNSLTKLTQSTEQQLESNTTGNQVKTVTPSTDLPRRAVDANSKCLPLVNPNQKFVAVNIGHQGQKCRTPAGAVRILGFFERADEITSKYDGKTDLDVFTLPVGSWFAITKKPTLPEEEEELKNSVVKRVNDYILKVKDETDRVVELSQSANEKDRYDESVRSLERMQKVDDFMENNKNTAVAVSNQAPPVDRNQEIRGQNYAVISIITDASPDDEPLVQFFQGFDSRDDARDYMRNTLHQTHIKTNCFVVQMYEWVVPVYTRSMKFKDTVEASFTHTELEELFQGQKWEKQKIDQMMQSEKAQQRLTEIQEEFKEAQEAKEVEPEEVD